MSEGDVVLVTGVAGFVGSAVARVLAGDGMAVRGLVRRHPTDAAGSAPRINLVDFPGELVEGDARDPVAVARAVAGVRYIVHVAADYRLWAPDASEIERNNLAMTTVMMDAAAVADAERIVYTSSVATLRPLAHGVADETRPATVEQAVGAYKKSKVAAERLVEQRAAGGLPVVIVNPSTPVGPRDARPTPTGRIIVEAANGRIPAFVDSGLNLVHVDDVARGHLLALRRGRIGERYVLGGDDVTLGTMLAAIAVRVGRRPPRVRLPRTPLLPMAWANETLARRTGRTPFLTLDAIRMAAHHMYFSSAKAHAELGYRARPWQAALDEALAWFEAQAMIAPRSARVRR